MALGRRILSRRCCKAGTGKEQGPKGNGHTFESCRVRQKSVWRKRRECGERISYQIHHLLDGQVATADIAVPHRLPLRAEGKLHLMSAFWLGCRRNQRGGWLHLGR